MKVFLKKEELSDKELLFQFQQGSMAAFESVCNRYLSRLYLHAFKMLEVHEIQYIWHYQRPSKSRIRKNHHELNQSKL